MRFLEARTRRGTLRLPLKPGVNILGRDPGCDLIVDDRSISRRHLALTPVGQGFDLLDLDSTNGVWLFGRAVAHEPIGAEQWFVAGNVLMAIREAGTLSIDSAQAGEAAAGL